MSVMRNQITVALANHPLIGVRGLCSLLCSDKGPVIKELKAMINEGLVEMKGRYYVLRPMYKQLEIFNPDPYAQDKRQKERPCI